MTLLKHSVEQDFFSQGIALHEKGQLDSARAYYAKALQQDPQHFGALHLMGVSAAQSQRFTEALEWFERALKIDAADAPLYNNRGNAYQELKQYDDALASYQRAFELDPQYAEAHYNHGNTLLALKNYQAALSSFDRAIALKPNDCAAYNNRGLALLQDEKFDAALASFNHALALNVRYTQAYYNRGTALMKLKLAQAALESFNSTLLLDAQHLDAHYNRALAYLALKEYEKAIEDFDWVIQSDERHVDSYRYRSYAYVQLQAFDQALESVERAIEVNPEDVEAQWFRALILLALGHFQSGWEQYEWREKRVSHGGSKRELLQVRWTGAESLVDKTILLSYEQGLGDVIQFSRYAKLVSDLGARVILEVPQTLANLMKRVEGVSQVLSYGEALPPFDLHCPLLSLPLALHTDLQNMYAPPRYLSASPEKKAYWQAKLNPTLKPRLGIVWCGNPRFGEDSDRSVKLDAFSALIPAEFECVSLKKDLPDAELEALEAHPDIMHFGDSLQDFDDTAALCELMDIIVTTDTSVAHLAAALGKPVWILLSFAPDWRWLVGRTDSPWYPSAKLYRQQAPGQWPDVFARVHGDLQAWAEDRRQKTEDRRQKTEDRRQKTEDRRQKLD